MLTAFKPRDSVYEGKKLYIKKSLLELKSKMNSFPKKYYLPIINDNKKTLLSFESTKEPLTQRESNEHIRFNSFNSFNSLYNNNINDNFVLTNFKKSNFNNNLNNKIKKIIKVNYDKNDFNRNNNTKPLLSDSFLPKLEETSKINSFYEDKNIINNLKCNYLYLKYDGEEFFNGIKKKMYIRINPRVIINSLENIISNNESSEKIINNLNKDINTNDNVTSTNNNIISTNINNNTSTHIITTDYNNIDINEYLNINNQGNYYLLSGLDNDDNDDNENGSTNNKSNNIKIKNIFLSDIIHKVYKHMVEIRDKRNEIIGKQEIKKEFNKQITNLRNYFNTQITIKNKEIKSSKTNKITNDIYNKIILNNKKKNEVYKINNFNNKFSEENKCNIKKINKIKIDNNVNERNNKEILKIFKEKLNIDKYYSIHNFYNNILNLSSNNNEKEKTLETNINKTIKNEGDLNLFKTKILNKEKRFLESKENSPKTIINKTQKMNSLGNFYREYKNIKQNITTNYENNREYIFEMGPKLHFVDFNEIINDIEYQSDYNNSNLDRLFYFILTDESLYNKVKFNNSIMQKCFNFYAKKGKNQKIFKKSKKIKKMPKIQKKFEEIDILKHIGDKLHKKIKIKIGRKKNTLTINTVTDFKEDNDINKKSNNYIKYRKSETFKVNLAEKAFNMTDSKIIETETNSSEYSDVPSYVSYTEIKKQKEEQSQKIKELKEKNEKINDEEIEKLIFKKNIPKKEEEKKNVPDKNKIDKKMSQNTKIIDCVNKNKKNIEKKNEKIPQINDQPNKIKEINETNQTDSSNNYNLLSKLNTHNIITDKYNITLTNNDTNNNNNMTKINTMYIRENKKEKSFIQQRNNSIKNKSKDNKYVSQKNLYTKENFKYSTKKNNLRISLVKREKEKERERDSESKKYNKINKKKNISDKTSVSKQEGRPKNKSFHKNRLKKINKNDNEKDIKPFKIEDSMETSKNNLFNNTNKRKLTKNTFSDFLTLINNELNIPGRNNKISINTLFSVPLFNKRRKSYILNSLDDEESEDYKSDAFLKEYNKVFGKNSNYNKIIEKNERFEKLKNEIIENNYKTISYFDLKESTRLILLRPILKYTLYRDHEKSNLSNIINKLFRVPNKLKLSLSLSNSTNSLNSNKSSSFISSEKSEISEYSEEDSVKDLKETNKKQTKRFQIKDDNAYIKRKIYKNMTEKYSLQYLKKKYSKDDNDLLNFRRNRIYKRLKKIDRGMGFREFMIEELNKIDEGNLSDDFENTQKENDKIRKQIKEKREEKRRRMEEWNKRFKKFKYHVQRLKKMDDVELKHDTIRFIFKEKEELEKKQIFNLKQAKRINEFKNFLSKQKAKRNIIDKFFVGQLVFKPNCVFSTKNVFH